MDVESLERDVGSCNRQPESAASARGGTATSDLDGVFNVSEFADADSSSSDSQCPAIETPATCVSPQCGMLANAIGSYRQAAALLN